MLFALNAAGSELEFSTGVALGPATILAMSAEPDGGVALAYAGSGPVTADATALPRRGIESTMLLKLAPGATRLVYSTAVPCSGCTRTRVSRGKNGWLVGFDPDAGADGLGPARPLVISTKEPRTQLYIAPDHLETCGPVTGYFPNLLWDTRDPRLQSVELRSGSPDGAVLSRNPSGIIGIPGTTRSYYLRNTTGGPFGAREVVATETFTAWRPLRCSDGPNKEESLRIQPNPVLSCRESFLSGTAAHLDTLYWAQRPGDTHVEIRAASPAGTVVGEGYGPVSGSTGDWVRNGMPFFTVRSSDKSVLATERAYLLPNRSCTSDAPPEPMIRATRDCVERTKFTLAMWAADGPVEIRQGSAAGPKVARFGENTGLFDVTVTAPVSYWLLSYVDGEWKSVASVNVDPNARCEQGAGAW